jgi:ubiquinol-cytochrome c reductase cytochrome c1 subunit
MNRPRRTVQAITVALFVSLVPVAFAPPVLASTQTTVVPLQHMKLDLSDREALRTGALYVLHRCSACHSIQGTRFSSIARQLQISNSQIQRYFNQSGRSVHDTVVSTMPADVMTKFVNMTPPDLTVLAKRRSPDWIYTYLKSFYIDPHRPTGVNNVVFHNVAMPDVLANLQGLQVPIMKSGWLYGQRKPVAMGVKQLTQGTMTPAQFDRTTQDIVDFLTLVAHPHAKERAMLGPWILGLFALMSVLSFLLYKLYWRRVIMPTRRWWHKQ